MILLLDIGNTNTHLGLANRNRVVKQANVATQIWFNRSASQLLSKFAVGARLEGAILCSVVPRATPVAMRAIKKNLGIECVQLNPQTVRGVGIAYPKPATIGPDR